MQDFTMIEKEIWSKWSFLPSISKNEFIEIFNIQVFDYYYFEGDRNILEMSEIYQKESQLVR